MSAWMTFEQAKGVALVEAAMTGHRYRVYKSRAVVGWWNAVQMPELIRGRAARTQRP